jgi:hypothetical protein
MRMRIIVLILAFPLGIAQASAGPATHAPDPEHGKKLASDLCSNCHLLGTSDQRQANADVPSFPEIVNKEGDRQLDRGAYRASEESNAFDSAHPGRACRSRRLYLDIARVEVTSTARLH